MELFSRIHDKKGGIFLSSGTFLKTIPGQFRIHPSGPKGVCYYCFSRT